MTHIEQAIRDAVEKGGYEVKNLQLNGAVLYADMFSSKPMTSCAELFLDPTFWQALGKARGWSEELVKMNGRPMPIWLIQWHEFIDDLADDKDAESFFKSLV